MRRQLRDVLLIVGGVCFLIIGKGGYRKIFLLSDFDRVLLEILDVRENFLIKGSTGFLPKAFFQRVPPP